MSTTSSISVKAGAGAGEIIFDQQMFPVEGFNGQIHTAPFVRVLFIESGNKFALVSFEMVNIPSDLIASTKKIIADKFDVPAYDIWVHATHAITTPHVPDDPAKRNLFVKAVLNAVDAAAEMAVNAIRPAKIGVGTCRLDVNANRGLQIGDNWYYGLGSTMPSNKAMTILSFRDDTDAPIGFLISYGIKPTAIDNIEMAQGTRVISTDVPGVACRIAEQELGAPVMFCMPAAGDQIPRETAMFYIKADDGSANLIELSTEKGVDIVERLGSEMGRAAVKLALSISCIESPCSLAAADTSFTWANKSGDGEVSIDVCGVALSRNIALIGLKPEINAVTEQQLWAASPYRHTLLMSFVDGDQKYMPDASAYDLKTWEFKRSGTAKGSAEKFVEVAVSLLQDMKSGDLSQYTRRGTATASNHSVTKKELEFGSTTWLVLEEQGGKALILSKKVLTHRAYHAPGGAITWENCELRTFLNNKFYEALFTNLEKSRILEVSLANNSNAQYGIPGGNNTTDKVFLLSLSEAEKYLGSGIELLRGIDIQTDEAVWWHLRSPGEAADTAASVNAIGLIDYHGVSGGVTDPSGGVRPAMWVRTDL